MRLLMRINWNWAFAGIALFYGVVLLLAYHGLIPRDIKLIPFYDELGHFTLLGLLALFLYKLLKFNFASLSDSQLILISAGITSSFTIAEEFAQQLSPYRAFDPMDMAFSLLGILVCILIARKLP
jgi:polysaccharide biosynthesis protein VpsQ